MSTEPVPTLPAYPQVSEKPIQQAVEPTRTVRFRVSPVRPGTQEKHYPRKPGKLTVPDRRYVKYY